MYDQSHSDNVGSHYSNGQKVVATILLFVTILFNAVPSLPLLPLGRTTATLIFSLMFIFFMLTPSEQAWRDVDFNTLAFLFGMMTFKVLFQKHGLAKQLKSILLSGDPSETKLLIRISLVSALLSVFITNDGACVFMTPVVDSLVFATRGSKSNDNNNNNNNPQTGSSTNKKYNILVLLIAVCSSCNIGSALVLTGNPQNVLIGDESGISFSKFFILSLIPTCVGLILNIIFLRVYCSYNLFGNNAPPEDLPEIKPEFSDTESDTGIQTQVVLDEENKDVSQFLSDYWKQNKKKLIIYMILFSLIILLFLSFFVVTQISRGWLTCGFAIFGIFLDNVIISQFLKKKHKHVNENQIYKKVEWNILIWFAGMFIIMAGFGRTGFTVSAWDQIFDSNTNYLNWIPLIKLFCVISVLSNLVGNVPLILLIAPSLQQSSSDVTWVIVGWISTIAGNLTLVGSAANVIVAEMNHSRELKFWNHLKFGLPTTLVISIIGTVIIKFSTQIVGES